MRLQDALDGVVVLPGAPDFETVRKPPMARFDEIAPQAVVLCKTPADVSETIGFAKRMHLQVAVRGGGHSVAGRSSTTGMVIDVSPMSSVEVDNGVVTVGAGVRLGDLYDALAEHGLTIPAGCGPTVGIAGLALGGGIGIMGRSHGLTSDHLLHAQIVLADGRVVECDDQHDEDLFWALRGAGGGNFGVVTSFKFRTLQAPMGTVFRLGWPLTHAEALIQAWQTWAPTAPDELDATLRLTAGGDDPSPRVELVGAMIGTDGDAAGLLDELAARAGVNPSSGDRQHMPYRAMKRYLADLGSVDDDQPGHASADPPPEGHIFSRSEFFRQPLPSEAITALVENLMRATTGDSWREVAFMPWGGAYNRVPSDATAFAHRDELFIIQHLTTISPKAAAAANQAERRWLERSWALVHPWGSGGVYPNFPDPDLEDWAHAYYGDNYDRLVRIKATYDPDDFFQFHQSLTKPRARTTR
jgi:FAD/FMN-containing dehydrogenase